MNSPFMVLQYSLMLGIDIGKVLVSFEPLLTKHKEQLLVPTAGLVRCGALRPTGGRVRPGGKS